MYHFADSTLKVFKTLSFALFQIGNRFFATLVPLAASATCSRHLFLAGSILKNSAEFFKF